MKLQYSAKALYDKRKRHPKIYKWIIRTGVLLLGLPVLLYIAFAWYLSSHKAEVLTSVTKSLNDDLSGTVTIGDIEPALVQGFPSVSLILQNVTIADSLYPKHKVLFLKAGNFDISVNALALLRGTVEIRKIKIDNADIRLYTDSTGYSNASIFRKRDKKSEAGGGTFPELRKFSLSNVRFSVDNREKSKLFTFHIRKMRGDIDFNSDGWEAGIGLDTHVHSMAFSTRKGSFIREKPVNGAVDIAYDSEKDAITVKDGHLKIGGEDFIIGAEFRIAESSLYKIRIRNESILWRNASALLSPNISSRLDRFDLEKPISVSCDIVGDFAVKGDPFINVKAQIRNNTLESPGGTVTSCSFTGEFTNNFQKNRGFNDKNSAILFSNFKGEFAGMPIRMDNARILDLERPIASGDFSSDFEVPQLNNIIDRDLLEFTKGNAQVRLKYRADIENFILVKPVVEGTVDIRDADVSYTPRKAAFSDVSVRLDFKDENLSISNIKLRTGKSVVAMEGEIKNFLNLVYTAPEEITVDWKVRSPQLHLGEFLGFLGARKQIATRKPVRKGNFTKELDEFFENINVKMTVDVERLYYKKFASSNAVASIIVNNEGVHIPNARINHAGGIVRVNGALLQKSSSNAFKIEAVVSKVDINKFFAAFDNFGLLSPTSENLRGRLSAVASLSGRLSSAGDLIPRSMNGKIAFTLDKGQLVNFRQVQSIGDLAFPNRDFSNIILKPINGTFDITGDTVKIHPMAISSSVLNMDVDGIFAFGPGTEIYIVVPLRNPDRDKDITDAGELAKRRNRGILLRLVARDGKDGKVKIALGKNREGV
ncbi:MAG TPA: AsmA-like C-terminal region-containing protein [Flavobacterium sp.]